MSIGTLLNALDGVKKTGDGKWVCKCPSHNDRKPSLAVRLLDDGRILINCLAGCDTYSVLRSVGLDWDAVMPESSLGDYKPVRQVISSADALRMIDFELKIVALSAHILAKGQKLPEDDLNRLLVARDRINKAVSLAGV